MEHMELMKEIKGLVRSMSLEQEQETWNGELVESMAAFARRLDVARSTITRAVQAGRILLTPAGLVRVEASIKSWHSSKGLRSDVSARHAATRGAEILKVQAPAPTAAGNDEQQGADEGDSLQDETRLRHQADGLAWQNKTMVIELDRVRGRRFEREAVLSETNGLGSALRSAVDRLIDQTAPRLAVAGSRAERHRLLVAELSQVRRMLKAEFPRALRRLAKGAAQTTLEQKP